MSARPAMASAAGAIVVPAAAAEPPGPPIDRAPSLFPSLRPFWGRLLRRRGYDIRPARTPHQQGVANALLRRMYAWRGCAAEAVLRPMSDDPNRLTLAAWYLDDVVATLTLGRDSSCGLSTDAQYASELDSLRRQGRVLCEVSGLAVDPDFSSPDLLTTLFENALHYAKDVLATSDAVIEVNSRHARYYEQRMGFRQIGRRRHCQGANSNNSPMILLHQSLGEVAIPRASASRSASLFGGRR